VRRCAPRSEEDNGEHVERLASRDTDSVSFDSFFGVKRMATRLLKGSKSMAADSMSDETLLGAKRRTERLLLNALGSCVMSRAI
jgi:hypothetical protein